MPRLQTVEAVDRGLLMGLLLVYSLTSPGSVYVFLVAWLDCGALQGEITTWLQWLFKTNRALTICQAC